MVTIRVLLDCLGNLGSAAWDCLKGYEGRVHGWRGQIHVRGRGELKVALEVVAGAIGARGR
jgi:hypothetical protein